VPGIAIGVLQDGAEVIHTAGVADVRSSAPVQPSTVFRLASLSKLFTATLAMRCVDDGTLDLDVPIITYLPELRLPSRRAGRSITMRHLLSHTSGLSAAPRHEPPPHDDVLAYVLGAAFTPRQRTAPGAVWAYSNVGYHLAGAVLARLADTSFEEAMRTRLFAPLGLDHTTYGLEEVPPDVLAAGHRRSAQRGKPCEVLPDAYPRFRNPAGGILSTASDVLRFAAMHLHDGELGGTRVLSKEATRAMGVFQVRSGGRDPAQGLGWMLRTLQGTRVLRHAGDVNGFHTQLTLLPARGCAIVILSNGAQGGPTLRTLEAWALARYGDLRPSPTADAWRTTGRWLRWQAHLQFRQFSWRVGHR
jgi:CubicO group peptidase (beta-lactamase class C family)